MKSSGRLQLLVIGFCIGLISLESLAQNNQVQNTQNNANIAAAQQVKKSNAESLHLIASKLQKITMMSSSFLQSKQIKILSRPLISSGSFIYTHTKGLSWRVEKPIVTRMLITQDGMYEYVENDPDRVKSIIPSSGPMTAFTNLFGALFTGNTPELEKIFSIEIQGESNVWIMELTPKNQNLAKFVKKIRLSGTDHVEAIDIDEINGDETRLTFSNVQLNRPLSAEEENYFKG